VSVLSDLRAARKVIGNAVASRTTRRALATRLAGRETPAPGAVTIALYFADPAVNLYQVRQWYAPLAELAEHYGIAIITRSPSSSLMMLDESPVPVVYCRVVTDIERFLDEQDIRIVLYVNQNTKNFQMFRYSRMWHVFINHGESDKMYDDEPVQGVRLRVHRWAGRARAARPQAVGLRPREAGDPDRSAASRSSRR
jgi:hypothetical protein